ncbi:RecQ family ATP-dependent DNA helicase [Myxococcota bacterium]
MTLAAHEERSPYHGGAGDRPLTELLRDGFGHDRFRAHQEKICTAIIAGQDALVVMPTGAGKSLCYQLPALVRRSTGLIISPLIALMEDQVAGLREQGLRAERIHSGRNHDHTTAVMHAYREGRLDYLFVAPERFVSTRFCAMLAEHKPALVAIDEAHCVSHWGHDFRPHYRQLRGRLAPLRPSPFVALTATATERVQRDILEQLGIEVAQRFIHGFRRDNIAIECGSLPRAERPGVVTSLLAGKGRLPAIIYAPTRKETEALAGTLAGTLRAAAYHAGMGAAQRDSVQRAFIADELDVIVATIAFGMGIDKPDIRTIVHTALPSSIEGYYQEIGRAGRDGEPSVAVLLHNYGDRKTHEWLHNKSYPETKVLRRVQRALGDEPLDVEQVRAVSQLDTDPFFTALDKLCIHGGAVMQGHGMVSRGDSHWQRPYSEQRQHRLDQIELVARFAEGSGCRMLRLIAHFGDREDHGRPCGRCDTCAPGASQVLSERPLGAAEAHATQRIFTALAERDGIATGRLFRETSEEQLPRRAFEALLVALERQGLIEVEDASFETEGRTVTYRKVVSTGAGMKLGRRGDLAVLRAAVTIADVPSSNVSEAKRGKRAHGKNPNRGARSSTKRKPLVNAVARGALNPELVAAFKAWRLAEARRRNIPAFRIFSNRMLEALVAAQPRSKDELLGVYGVGPKLVDAYGEELLRLLRES